MKKLNITYNVFISCDFNESRQIDIYDYIMNYYNDDNDINIIDVSEKNTNTTEIMITNILQQINQSDIFNFNTSK